MLTLPPGIAHIVMILLGLLGLLGLVYLCVQVFRGSPPPL